jgi:hypothetical protein
MSLTKAGRGASALALLRLAPTAEELPRRPLLPLESLRAELSCRALATASGKAACSSLFTRLEEALEAVAAARAVLPLAGVGYLMLEKPAVSLAGLQPHCVICRLMLPELPAAAARAPPGALSCARSAELMLSPGGGWAASTELGMRPEELLEEELLSLLHGLRARLTERDTPEEGGEELLELELELELRGSLATLMVKPGPQ